MCLINTDILPEDSLYLDDGHKTRGESLTVF